MTWWCFYFNLVDFLKKEKLNKLADSVPMKTGAQHPEYS